MLQIRPVATTTNFETHNAMFWFRRVESSIRHEPLANHTDEGFPLNFNFLNSTL